MPGGLDHLVVVARDLDRLVHFYKDLGFTVGARNRHDWGTLNNIVQFDGCFLELLTTEEGFSPPSEADPINQFAGPLSDYLGRREGIAMSVLESHDAAQDQAHFDTSGIAGPSTFFFERRGKRPDGSDVHVAFSLAFARMAGHSNGGFFVCQQHFPEAFWNAAFQRHANGVTGIRNLTFLAHDVVAATDFFQRYTGCSAADVSGGEKHIATERGQISIVDRDTAQQRYGAALPDELAEQGFIAVHFPCPALDDIVARVKAAGIEVERTADRVVLPAESAFGAVLVFEVAT